MIYKQLCKLLFVWCIWCKIHLSPAAIAAEKKYNRARLLPYFLKQFNTLNVPFTRIYMKYCTTLMYTQPPHRLNILYNLYFLPIFKLFWDSLKMLPWRIPLNGFARLCRFSRFPLIFHNPEKFNLHIIKISLWIKCWKLEFQTAFKVTFTFVNVWKVGLLAHFCNSGCFAKLKIQRVEKKWKLKNLSRWKTNHQVFLYWIMYSIQRFLQAKYVWLQLTKFLKNLVRQEKDAFSKFVSDAATGLLVVLQIRKSMQRRL